MRFLMIRAGGWKTLAVALGFSKHTVTHVKKGEKNVSPTMALRVARLAAVAVDDVFRAVPSSRDMFALRTLTPSVGPSGQPIFFFPAPVGHTAVVAKGDERGGISRRPKPELEFEASGKTPVAQFKISGRGTYAIGAAAASALLAEFVWLDPLHNPQHFLVTLFTTAVSMFIFGTATQAARVDDLKDQVGYYRDEIERMSREKKALEEAVVKRRLSSDAFDAPKKLPPKSGRG